MTLIIPDGKMTGCLPRESRYGDWFPKAEDRIDIAPESQWEEMIAAGMGDMTSYIGHCFDQDGEGSCAFESTAQAGEIIHQWQGQPPVLLNPWSGYAFTKVRGGGSSIDRNLQHFQVVGLLPMDVWPRSKGLEKPPQSLLDRHAVKFRGDEAFDGASVQEAVSCLFANIPFVFGWRGHSCVLVKVESPTVGVYQNSWDPTWGFSMPGVGDLQIGGKGRIRFSEINWGYGGFGLRTMVDMGG